MLRFLAIAALLAVPAAAQLTCQGVQLDPPSLRNTSKTDLAGDIGLSCSGGTPTASGAQVPTVNLTVYYNTTVTNPAPPSPLEPLLYIDDNLYSRLLCTSTTGCPLTGTGTGNGTYDSTTGRYNSFLGTVNGNSITFNGVPLDPPAKGATRTLRIANVRVDASGLVTGNVIGYVSVSGNSVQVANAAPTLGAVTGGATFQVQSGGNAQVTLAAKGVGVPSGSPIGLSAYLQFKAQNAGVFRERVQESGWEFTSQGTTIGLADFGTRLMATFSGVPSGVHVYVGIHDLNSQATLTYLETGPFSAVPSQNQIGTSFVSEVALTSGSGTAVWEIVNADITAAETLYFPVYFSSDATVGPGTGTVIGGLGPQNTTLSVPRFVPSSSQSKPVTLVSSAPTASCSAVPQAVVGSGFNVTCTASGGTAPYQWALTGSLPTGLNFGGSGATFTIGGSPATPGSYQFLVAVTDANGFASSVSFAGTILAPVTVSCTPSAGPTNVGKPYSTTCTATGGTSPYRWAVTSGTLPTGISLSATSGSVIVVSGPPTSAGNYAYSITATDSSPTPLSVSTSFSGSILGTVSVACAPATGPVSTVSFYTSTCALTGGTPPYRWAISVGSLPFGLSLSGGTAASTTISGTPTVVGPYGYTLTGTDANGLFASAAFSGTIVIPGCPLGTPSISSVQSLTDFGGGSSFTGGSYLEIKGTGLATASRLWATADFVGPNAPVNLDGTRVTINGKSAFVEYISATQVNVQAPDDTAIGNVPFVLSNCAGASNSVGVPRASLAPGLLAPASFNVGGKQYLVALFTDGVYVGNVGLIAGVAFRPAKPGDLVQAYGVGFGPVTPAAPPGVVASQLGSIPSVTVLFGSTPATLAYGGIIPGTAGEHLFQIVVPNVADGDYPITMRVGSTLVPQTVYLTVHK